MGIYVLKTVKKHQLCTKLSNEVVLVAIVGLIQDLFSSKKSRRNVIEILHRDVRHSVA